MPRKYRQKIGGRSYKNYTDNILDEALNKIANGELSILAASKAYKTVYGTLHNKLNGRHLMKIGHLKILISYSCHEVWAMGLPTYINGC